MYEKTPSLGVNINYNQWHKTNNKTNLKSHEVFASVSEKCALFFMKVQTLKLHKKTTN